MEGVDDDDVYAASSEVGGYWLRGHHGAEASGGGRHGSVCEGCSTVRLNGCLARLHTV